MGLRHALFVERVAQFVDGGIEAVHRIVGIDARRDAGIAPGTGGKGVDGQVQPSGLEIVADLFRQHPRQSELRPGFERS